MGRKKEINRFLVVRAEPGDKIYTTIHSGPYDTISEAKIAQTKWFLEWTQSSQIVQVKTTVSHYDSSVYLTGLTNKLNIFLSEPTVSNWKTLHKFAKISCWVRDSRKLCQCPNETTAGVGLNSWSNTDCTRCSYNIKKNNTINDFTNFFNTFEDKRFRQVGVENPMDFPWSRCMINIIAQIDRVNKKNMGALVKLGLSLSSVLQTPPKYI